MPERMSATACFALIFFFSTVPPPEARSALQLLIPPKNRIVHYALKSRNVKRKVRSLVCIHLRGAGDVFVGRAFQPATIDDSAQAGWKKLSQNYVPPDF